jgi:signal transduction histidine kinase
MRRHAVAVDVLVATAYLVVGGFGTASAWLATGVGRPPAVDATLTLALVVTAGALLVRRRRPVATFVIVLASTVASAVVSPGVDPVGLSLALYALAVHRTSRAGWIGFATAVVVGAVVVPLSAVLRADPGEGAGVPVISPIPVLVLLVAVLVGVTVGGRRRHVAALVDRAERLERERDQRERLATAAERARITREMHDIVAHGISVMVSLADGAEALVEKEPARSRAALGDIGDVGRRSLTDMRRLLGTLGRDDEASDVGLGPAPSVADLPALVETCRAAGLPVVLETSGVAPRSEGVQTVVYRIVQEALTNALRYAESPQEARVTIAYGPPVTVVVADDGRGPVDGRAPLGEGRGLVGMRERARLYGGSVEAGPGPGGGWRVAVDLPDVEEGR